MSRRFLVLTALPLILGTAARVNAQAPGETNRQYMLINATRPSTVENELGAAGKEGLAVIASGDFSVVLKRDGRGPRTYELVATDDSKLLNQQLSEAGARGFKLVRPGIWKLGGRFAAILESQAGGGRFNYDVVKADDAETIRAKQTSGATRAAVLDTFVIMERREGSQDTAASVAEYRIVSASRPGTMEKEIRDAAAAGYRAVGAGKMTVVMERDSAAPSTSREYRVLAASRLPTLRRELQAAAAEGFEIAVVPTRDNEFVAVLERPIGIARKLDYAVEEVTEKNADERLRALDADGYALERISGVRLLAFARRAAR